MAQYENLEVDIVTIHWYGAHQFCWPHYVFDCASLVHSVLGSINGCSLFNVQVKGSFEGFRDAEKAGWSKPVWAPLIRAAILRRLHTLCEDTVETLRSPHSWRAEEITSNLTVLSGGGSFWSQELPDGKENCKGLSEQGERQVPGDRGEEMRQVL